MNNSPQQPNRIDPTPVRISTNVTVDRQTPKTDFGDRVKYGIDTAAGAVANGAAVAASIIPGGAIVSAAVSSVNNLSSAQGSGPIATSTHYATSGVLTLAGNGGAGINTTVGAPSGPAVGTTVSGSPNYLPGGANASGTVGQMSADLVHAQAENAKLMQVQIAMQRENQVFTTVSNVLKQRHDTVKNTIQNVR
jgi:hypothetical protein